MALRVNAQAVAYARQLIKEGNYALDEKGTGHEKMPSRQEEDEYLARHGFTDYGPWYLGINDAKHGDWLVPVLGIAFLPFTTLMYVLVWTPQYGVYGFDWFWVILALCFDLSHWATAGYTNRARLPWFTQV
jgi:hypothetical protein